MNVTEKIIQFESGELLPDEVIDLFSELIRTGLAWELQGMYGRTAKDLIHMGYLSDEGEVLEYPY